MGRWSERGQMVPFAGFLVGSMALTAVLLAHVGAAANTAARAQTAADSAALAGVKAGENAARTAAQSNGASIKGITRDGRDVVVEVVIGDRSAKARARLDGGLTTVKG